jgi:quinol monooxygenase YgiN
VVICFFGTRYRPDADREAEARLMDELFEELRTVPGVISYHAYRAEDGEEVGLIRFESRQALRAWRDNPRHQSVWPRADEFFESFFIQNCETFAEYSWERGIRSEADLAPAFRDSAANLARET